MPNPPKAERNTGLSVQLHLQLSQRQIRLRGHPVHHLTLCLDTGPQFTARVVRNPLGLASAVPLRGNLLGPAQAHQEAIRKFLQCLFPLIVGQQKLTAQIISIWLRHRFTRRRVSPKPVYTIKENALIGHYWMNFDLDMILLEENHTFLVIQFSYVFCFVLIPYLGFYRL
jgi:hypothetical protein